MWWQHTIVVNAWHLKRTSKGGILVVKESGKHCLTIWQNMAVYDTSTSYLHLYTTKNNGEYNGALISMSECHVHVL